MGNEVLLSIRKYSHAWLHFLPFMLTRSGAAALLDNCSSTSLQLQLVMTSEAI